MMRLIEGIKVVDYHLDDTSLKPRIWLNSGTFMAKNSSEFEQYDQQAFLPSEPWREADITEQKIIYGKDQNVLIDKNNQIGILRLPDTLLEPLEELGVAFANSEYDCSLLCKEPIYQQFVYKVTEYIHGFSQTSGNLMVHPLGINPPGLKTVTYDQLNNFYIGLHLDSWDKLPLEQRHLSTNRICFNLGLEDRYLLFINLTLIDMLHLQNVDNWDDPLILQWENRQEVLRKHYFQNLSGADEILPDIIRQKFLHYYPEYPVIKVRVSPGEAYIAPTENMIHDGSTFGKSFFDVTLTIRGHIGFPCLPAQLTHAIS